MNSTMEQMQNWLISEQSQMVQTLYELCEINSGSHHIFGLEKLHERLQRLFFPLADAIEIPKLPNISVISLDGEKQSLTVGKPLLIRKRPKLQKRILLCGHMDTVFGKDHSFQTLTQIGPNLLQGPGVTDMKGGLVVMRYALAAFEQLPEAQSIGWDVFINADEEIGSPASGPFLESIAHQYTAGFVYEPAQNTEGLFVKNRKGSLKFTIVATGKAAHAGRVLIGRAIAAPSLPVS